MKIKLPDVVARRLETLGHDGAQWRATLPDVLSRLQAQWDLTLHGVMNGGSAALVFDATMSSHTPCVLKVPLSRQPTELALLRMANGRGYAKVLRHEPHAWVLARLGSPLDAVVTDPQAQLRITCQALTAAWMTATQDMCAHWPTGAQKASGLREWLRQGQHRLAHHQEALACAMDFLDQRECAFLLTSSVLAHGDPHAQNLLQDQKSWKFIDPEGLVIEPAYDLGVLMREWSMIDLQQQPLAMGLQWCQRLAQWSGVDVECIWQWAMIERVSTALMFLHLDLPQEAATLLEVADHWARR